MDERRTLRVAEAIREELFELFYELSDPRLGPVDITEVLVSPDFSKAQVRVLPSGDAAQQEASLNALEHARHYLRRQLASRLGLFRTPDVHFEAAVDAATAARYKSLHRRVRKGRPKDGEPPG